MPEEDGPYNPLDYDNLGHNVADALLARPALPLSSLSPFKGAGIYVLYYSGPFELYAQLANANRDGDFHVPIYAGKAIPAGARKGGRAPRPRGLALYRRLVEHGASCAHATNLDIEDFSCRYLVVEDIWIPLGESLLIERFQPLWNRVIDGFGNHDPGGGRHAGQRPLWDVLHPGRPWAERLRANERTPSEVAALVVLALSHLTNQNQSTETPKPGMDSDR